MARGQLRILFYLALEALVLFGVFFIMSTTLGITNDPSPGPRALTYFVTVSVFSLLATVMLIMTRVMIWRAARAQKSAGTEHERKTDIEALCEHLRQIGLDATVESKQPSRFRTLMATAIMVYVIIFQLLWGGFMLLLLSAEMQGILFGGFIFILAFPLLLLFDPRPSSPDSFLSHSLTSLSMGSVRVANRNIDLIELQLRVVSVGSDEYTSVESRYECNYVVQAKIEGLENKLKAKTRPVKVKKGFSSREIVDFRWEGGELAEALNNDASLRDALHHMKDRDMKDRHRSLDASKFFLFFLKTKPDRKHECVRIKQEGGYVSLESAFPTIETFEALDRIAQHIRSIANVRL